jgi:hypothetical protein
MAAYALILGIRITLHVWGFTRLSCLAASCGLTTSLAVGTAVILLLR